MASAFPNNLVDLSSSQGKVCRTFGIKFITSPEIVYLVRNAGFHAIFIDLEHSTLSIQSASQLCIAALNVSLSPFVRVPRNADPGFVQRVLDGGAQGVVFPHIDTPEQAREAVSASKYPPIGKRSMTGMLPHMGFRSTPISEVSALGNSRMSTVIVMIESPEGVANVRSITAVDGVDVVLVGTNDLSVELDIPGQFEHEKFVDAFESIAAATKEYGKILGVAGIYNRPDILRDYVHRHRARFVLGQLDMSMIAHAATATVTELKKLEQG